MMSALKDLELTFAKDCMPANTKKQMSDAITTAVTGKEDFFISKILNDQLDRFSLLSLMRTFSIILVKLIFNHNDCNKEINWLLKEKSRSLIQA